MVFYVIIKIIINFYLRSFKRSKIRFDF